MLLCRDLWPPLVLLLRHRKAAGPWERGREALYNMYSVFYQQIVTIWQECCRPSRIHGTFQFKYGVPTTKHKGKYYVTRLI
jgi:hypothetical protein